MPARRHGGGGGHHRGPVKRTKPSDGPARSARDAVAPWQSVPYAEQLARKHAVLSGALQSLSTRFNVPVDPVLASPLTTGYRNKVDFTIGYDKDRNAAVGFRVSSFLSSDGATVEAPDDCAGTVPALGMDVARRAVEFIRASTLLPFDHETHVGFWRALTVRISEANKQLMLCVRAAPHTNDVEAGKAEMTRFVQAMAREPFADGQTVTSALVQWHGGLASQPPADLEHEVALGADHIVEGLLGMNFVVSPGAFFQANTPCAQVLFELCRSKVAGEASAALLDICCGTGVIGQLLAKAFSVVVGVDMNGPGIADARRNAANNGVTHAHYIHAKAEDVLARLLGTPDGKQRPALDAVDEAELVRAKAKTDVCATCVAIVDPPRPGLHKSVLRALLENAKVRTVVYVSCSPTGSFGVDAAALCEGRRGALPFELASMQPVDMFPNTEHCELVAVFHRRRAAAASPVVTPPPAAVGAAAAAEPASSDARP